MRTRHTTPTLTPAGLRRALGASAAYGLRDPVLPGAPAPGKPAAAVELERERRRAERAKWQARLRWQLAAHGLTGWVEEYRFDTAEEARARGDQKGRRAWRFDFANPALKLAVEIHGGTHSQGRHNRGAGMAEDMEKANAALLAGWRVLAVDGGMVERGEAVALVLVAVGRFGA